MHNANIKVKHRNTNIELLRIIACLIVISLHINLSLDNNWLLIKSFLLDAVPCFFIIMGFFLFNGRNFKQISKKTFTSIFIPSFIIMLLSQIFKNWILGQVTLEYILTHFNFHYKILFSNIIQWGTDATIYPHLWYIFEYIKIILWFPLLKLICSDDNKTINIRRYIMGISIIAIIINDFQQFHMLPIGAITTFEIINKNILYVLIGYEVYLYRNKLSNSRILTFTSLITFILSNTIRYVLQIYLCNIKSDALNDYFMHTGRFIGLISSLSLFILIFSLNIKTKLLSSAIQFIASKTFYIYLIHWAVFSKLNTIGLRDKILEINSQTLLGKCLYTVEYAIICFTISITIVSLFDCLKYLLFGIKNKINLYLTKQ